MLNDVIRRLEEQHNEGIHAPVGHELSDQIHLGRGTWSSKHAYVLAGYNVKISTKQLFVRNISVAVFGFDVLNDSTVTGRGSNRNRESKKPKAALDPLKLRSIKDIYKYFLINNVNMDNLTAEDEAEKTNRYITRKIAQIKQNYSKPSKEEKKILGHNAQLEIVNGNALDVDNAKGNVVPLENGNVNDVDVDNGNSNTMTLGDERNEDFVGVDDSYGNGRVIQLDVINENHQNIPGSLEEAANKVDNLSFMHQFENVDDLREENLVEGKFTGEESIGNTLRNAMNSY